MEGAFAVIGMGKLGGGEMTATSDLDLLCIYDAADGVLSDGPKPLDALSYYTRLIRRLIAAIAAPTAEGVLYEIDMALRPSGGAGPTAVRLSAFAKYFEDDAWTWEKMALCRAHVLTGPAAFRTALEAKVQAILTAPRDPQATLKDVAAMRRRIEQAKPASGPWDVKHVRGGLIDIDFIIQALQLVHAPETPAVLQRATPAAVSALAAAGALSAEEEARLLKAGRLLRAVLQFTRLSQEGAFDPAAAGPAFRAALAHAVELAGPDALEPSLAAAEANVLEIYNRIIESRAGPA